MIRRTMNDITRIDRQLPGVYVELVRVETWWLLWIIPLYSRETILRTNR